MTNVTPTKLNIVEDKEEMITPSRKEPKTPKTLGTSGGNRTPMQIPPTPLLEKLGFGTGIY